MTNMWGRMDVKVQYNNGAAFVEIPRELLRQMQIYPDDVVALTIHRESDALNIRRADVQDQLEHSFKTKRMYNGNQ